MLSNYSLTRILKIARDVIEIIRHRITLKRFLIRPMNKSMSN